MEMKIIIQKQKMLRIEKKKTEKIKDPDFSLTI